MDEQDIATRVLFLEDQVKNIRERNQRVELHKSWETSRTRVASVTAVTYVTMSLIFVVLGSRRPFLDALVPTSGFFLSTLSLPFIRAVWERRVSRPD